MSNKKCKKDEILNPDTNRCVKRNGTIGKRILAEMNKKECGDDEILNPKTNRCASISGKLGKHPKIYYPPNKVLYKNRIATITCRYYGMHDVMNTYGIKFDDTGSEKDFIHYDDLLFLSEK